MKFTVQSIVLSSVLALSAVAHADNNMYVSGALGTALSQGDSALNGFLELGTRLDPVRVGIELGDTHKRYDETYNGTTARTTVDMRQVFGNVYYDFLNCSAITPYVGLGLGYLNVKAKANVAGISASDTMDAFGYQGIAGLAYKVNETTSVFADYRYVGSNDFKYDGTDTKIKAHINEFNAGVTLKF
jgi:opacity protein-like surface antigen